jgi:hypothetical protein
VVGPAEDTGSSRADPVIEVGELGYVKPPRIDGPAPPHAASAALATAPTAIARAYPVTFKLSLC